MSHKDYENAFVPRVNLSNESNSNDNSDNELENKFNGDILDNDISSNNGLSGSNSYDDIENMSLNKGTDDLTESSKNKKSSKDNKNKSSDDDTDNSIKGKKDKKNKSDDKDDKKDKNINIPGVPNIPPKLRNAMLVSQMLSSIVKLMIALKLLKMLKMFLNMLLMLAKSVIQSVVGIVTTVINIITAFLSTLSTTVVTIAIIVFSTSIVGITLGIISTIANNTAQRNDITIDCYEEDDYMAVGNVDASTATLENAQKTYAILKVYGMSDENIAGVLGNWSAESGIMPYKVETVYNEDNIFTPQEGSKKYSYEFDTISTPTGNEQANFRLKIATSSGTYGLRNIYSNLATYSNRFPRIEILGIGLGQWTNGRNTALMDYAKRINMGWYLIETQLLFMLDSENGDTSGAKTLATWCKNPSNSPAEAADYFFKRWEACDLSRTTPQIRIDEAEKWYVEIASWQEGTDYDLQEAESLISLIGSAGASASNTAANSKYRACSDKVMSDNSSLVNAALSFAWEPGIDTAELESPFGQYYEGTPCWQHLRSIIMPGDNYPRSCDRTVAMAVKWSGTDTDIPNGNVRTQYSYFVTSPYWQEVTWSGSQDELQPGDILIHSDKSHIVMYVGADAVKQKYGAGFDNYVIVDGSIGAGHTSEGAGARPPAVRKWYSSLSDCYVFRNVTTNNNNSEWTSATCVS